MFADDSSLLSAEPFTLGQYIAALIETIGVHHPSALQRMRLVVGGLRARIGLDNEEYDVYFDEEELVVQLAAKETAVDGAGATDSATVLALLDGYLEVTDAILDGRLDVMGKAEDVARMFTAIEILLDASPRTPALQSLALRFRSERGKGTGMSFSDMPGAWYPFASKAAEQALLQRLGLLPDKSDA